MLLNSIIVFLGEYLGYILLAGLLVFWWENKKKYPRFFWESIAAAILSRGIVTELIRALWYRARPFVEQGFTPLIEHSPSASFPSGHATFFFALGTVLYLYNKKAGALFLLAAAILSAARVAAGLHWQSDIIAGAAIGIVAGVLVVWISRKFL